MNHVDFSGCGRYSFNWLFILSIVMLLLRGCSLIFWTCFLLLLIAWKLSKSSNYTSNFLRSKIPGCCYWSLDFFKDSLNKPGKSTRIRCVRGMFRTSFSEYFKCPALEVQSESLFPVETRFSLKDGFAKEIFGDWLPSLKLKQTWPAKKKSTPKGKDHLPSICSKLFSFQGG